MPNPVPLATKEEEERRAWVTAHHEVVRLIKECFGDRFSNNEIFDRLKISRRTGYRALGNDERIGKAPGRKPKIAEETIREMIEYIENGGCNDVGNVWKHLAEKFAPDCNPKTVQDAVKKSGFKNYHSTLIDNHISLNIFGLTSFLDNVKLEPLLNEPLPDNQMAPIEEDAAAEQLQQEQNSANEHAQQVEQAQQAEQMHREQQQQHQQQNVFDPALQHQTPPQSANDVLRDAISSAPEGHVRYVLHELTNRLPQAWQVAHQYLCSQFPGPSAPPVAQMSAPPQIAGSPLPAAQLRSNGLEAGEIINTKGRRIAVCRRCNQHFDRAENTMESRSCLYHKGSPQKTDPNSKGTIETDPTAFIWSCCGGNGDVRGCCRAMHTTKKKRKYSSKKRSASEAGLDNDSGDDVDESTIMESAQMTPTGQQHYDSPISHQQAQTLQSHPHLGGHIVNDANIDSSLQDLQPQMHGQQQIHVQNMQMGAPQAAMQSGRATPQGLGSDHDLSALQMANQQGTAQSPGS